MQPWSGFFGVLAACAATLLGLLFVTASINAASILGAARASSRKIAEQAFQNYIAVLLVSLVALIPDIDPPSLGITSVALTAVGMVLVLVRVPQIWRAPGNGRSNLRLLRRHGSSLAGFILLFYSSVLMAHGDQHHFNLFAASLIVLLAAATTVSWELLVYLSKEGRAD
jgi:uncharacterized membrane protein